MFVMELHKMFCLLNNKVLFEVKFYITDDIFIFQHEFALIY